MLAIDRVQPDILQLTLSGVVDKTDIEKVEAAITPMLEGDGRIGLLIDIVELEDMTGDAIAEDMRFEFGMLAQWSKVARLALITDKKAFEAMMRWADPLLPSTEMLSFGPDRVEAARGWVADFPRDAEETAGRGIRIIEDGTDGLLAFEIIGSVTREDAARVLEPFQRLTGRDRKIDLMVRITDFSGFDPAMLVDGEFLGSKFQAIGHVRRYAIVGAPAWMRTVANAAAAVLPFDIRTFDLDDETAARAWLRQT